jgi:hypothetical protein
LQTRSDEMKKYGFLKTFIGVCSGTAIFPEIVKFPFRRMLWHLFIIASIGSIINVAFRYHPIDVGYEETCRKLEDKFGNIVFSDKGIRPEKDPDKPGTIYMDDFRIDYFPKMADLKNFKPEKGRYLGLAWTPNSASIWVMPDRKVIPVYPFYIASEISNEDASEMFNHFGKVYQGDMDSTLSLYDMADLSEIPSSEFQPATIPFKEFKTNMLFRIPMGIKTIAVIFLASEILGNCLLATPFYILIFSAFSFFLGRSSILPMKFSEIFVVGIYTGFPGLVIATFFTALQLPFLNFQSIFLIAYLFYSFPVFARLRFAQMQKENMKDEDDEYL